MTYQEYAKKNIGAMLSKEPTPQDMRDLALLSLWLDLSQRGIETHTQQQTFVIGDSTARRELTDIFPALSLYQKEHNSVNLKKLCVEIEEFCSSVYASTESDEERRIYKEMASRLNK